MTTCDKCKFWERDIPESPVKATLYGRCGRLKHLGICIDVLRSGAIAFDSTGNIASLWTLPNFGCNAGEER